MIAATIVLLAPRMPGQDSLLLSTKPFSKLGRVKELQTSSSPSPGDEIGLLSWEVGRRYPFQDFVVPVTDLA